MELEHVTILGRESMASRHKMVKEASFRIIEITCKVAHSSEYNDAVAAGACGGMVVGLANISSCPINTEEYYFARTVDLCM